MTADKALPEQKLPLNRAIISDLLLWMGLALLAAFAVYWFAIALPARCGQVITLSFKDANELSKGSAVRFMGTDVGFVDDIRIRKDHVELKVQTYPDALKIPSGAVFTILFTGLGGSKSVEVVAPDGPRPFSPDGKPVYLVEQPIRMKDTLNAGIDVTQALQKGAENIADFFGKRKPVEELQFNIRQARDMSTEGVRNSGELNAFIHGLRQDVHDNSRVASDTLGNFTRGVAQAARFTEPKRLTARVRKLLADTRALQDWMEAPVDKLGNPQRLEQRLAPINAQGRRWQQGMATAQAHVAHFPLKSGLQTMEQRENRFIRTLNRVSDFLSHQWQDWLENARKNIQGFSRWLTGWSGKPAPPPSAAPPVPAQKP